MTLKPIFVLLILKCGVVYSQKTVINVALPDARGNTVELKDIIAPNKPTFMSFWASWCKPCIEEISVVDRMIKNDHLGVNFVIINIDEERTLGRAKSIAKQKSWSAWALFDTNQSYMKQLGVQNLPQSNIYDSRKALRASFNAYIRGDELKYLELLK
jgi:cytochrome c biogenesis protein CcmG, thiol:disulfide interchange protein DsbE